MSGRKYYCFCEDNCKFETMTKEQILAAIAEAAETGLVYDADAAVISKVLESNAGAALTFWKGTQAQYNAIAKKDANCYYIITDDNALELVGNIAAGALQTTGGTMSGDISMGGNHRITGLRAPHNANDAATKAYALHEDVIWQNTDYESTNIFKTFKAQTLDFGGLEQYDAIQIVMQQATSARRFEVLTIPKALSGLVCAKTVAWWDSSAASVGIREVTINFAAGTVQFADAQKNGASNNYCMIPYRIIGIKGGAA